MWFYFSSGSITSDSLATDTRVYNSGGNANFKIQSSSTTRKFEAQTNGTFYLWDESNNEIFHFRHDKQVDFKNDLNTTGLFYSNGILVSSSQSIKKDIKDIEDNGLFNKLKFKQYL